ncbi:hypothetical protein F2Q68_00014738 [Brassica cretica]|uniref:Uncharacterized protein n=1 Tax=Brassica cretica TaxID=69181 RepID=A0A8S9HL06_BRACR|nr:hypothetical protein F2Q68_00014738 [Brassica cretica]
MNKHLVETFVAFRNSHGRSRYAEDDQEDTPGDEVLAIDQGRRGRMPDLLCFHFREKSRVLPKVIRKKFIGESCTRFAMLPFSAINLGFSERYSEEVQR